MALCLGACGVQSTPAGVAAHTLADPVTIAAADPNAVADPNAPLVATTAPSPPGPWTWMPIAGSQCADGSPTGIGLSVAADSDLLMIFLQGGGRCDSANTCGNVNATSANLDGFTGADFNKTIGGQTGIFNRKDATNPLAQASMVFVPYCTGDDHSGDNKATYGTQHRGYANMGLALQALVPMFPKVQQVLITGSSAGGSGAYWNYYRTQQAFGEIQVTLLDDAGPFIGQPVQEFTAASVTEWGLAKTVPTGCTNCLPGKAPAGVQNFYAFFRSAMPHSRGALLTSDEDAHVSERDMLNGTQFAAALNTLADDVGTSDPAFKFFYVPSTQHTWLGGTNGSLSQVKAHGQQLNVFVEQLLSNDPNWVSAR